MITEIILGITTLSLIVLVAYREKQHDEHIKNLEDKIVKTNPEVYWKEKNEGKRPVPNEMASEDREEVPIADIPMMEFTDRDFKIEMEGDPETPAEAVARD